jgi:hypothetical protein
MIGGCSIKAGRLLPHAGDARFIQGFGVTNILVFVPAATFFHRLTASLGSVLAPITTDPRRAFRRVEHLAHMEL